MGILSLFDLATRVFVAHVKLLRAYTEAIPAVLYESLLETSFKTDRILSARHLFLSWPFRKLSMVDCSDFFTEEFAIVLAHSLEEGCNKLREVDLTGCEIGVQGTTSLLKLTAGLSLPNVTKYCSSTDATAMSLVKERKNLWHRLSITAECFVDDDNYHLFRDVLKGSGNPHDITVSYFHAIALGEKRIKKILKELAILQAESVIGLNLEMNGLPMVMFELDKYKSLGSFPNLQYLNLSHNQIFLPTVHRILQCISAPLTHLIINDCGITSDKELFDEIANFPSVQKLKHLEVAGNLLHVSKDVMKLFLKCHKTLSFLSLKKNGLHDRCVKHVIQLLEPPFALETLLIGQNCFTLDSRKLLYKKDTMGRIKDNRHTGSHFRKGMS